MPDYKQGKIYTIRCKTDDTLIYVDIRMYVYTYVCTYMLRPN
jgi:hypothetical protein